MPAPLPQRLLPLLCGAALALPALPAFSATGSEDRAPLPSFGGIYPHLAMFSSEGEVGIGAIVPWADRLWVITYPPHKPHGSTDKLYAIDAGLEQTIRPESVGGTHACRLFHRESQQLFIGPYAIDSHGAVRAIDLTQLVGRMTGIARHLSDPANKVYYYDMEGALYEVDVHSLAVHKLFARCAPGCHGKGAYTAQGHLVISNNGEGGAAAGVPAATGDPGGPEAAGALAEWDGTTWSIVQRRQFTEVTGPGGIGGSPSDDSPLWSMGWDRRSVILELRDHGHWLTYRLPKASHAFDPRHGWYTEWPRIREIAAGRMLMAMHGMLYDFPPGFCAASTAGLAPICSHLRYITDFCSWNGRLVISSDDASSMQNPMDGQSQSNLWFGNSGELPTFGPSSGWGGPWLHDPVVAGVPCDPFLIRGFSRIAIHLAAEPGTHIAIEIDAAGDGRWAPLETVSIPAGGYAWRVLPATLDAQWLRCTADHGGTATAYLHCSSPRPSAPGDEAAFASLATVGDRDVVAGLVRPSGASRNLQWTPIDGHAGAALAAGYREIDGTMAPVAGVQDRSHEVATLCAIPHEFTVDDASVVMVEDGKRWRLPKGDAAFDAPFAWGWPRATREVQSERFLLNVHGTIYERPREHGLPLIRPICSHHAQIMDFCSWRGMLVLSGTRPAAVADGHFAALEPFAGGTRGLWFGMVDDLWKLGRPRGHGGPWAATAVAAGIPSDPYLMTGFDSKTLTLSHDASSPVSFTIEVDPTHGDWFPYLTVTVPAGQQLVHVFPAGFSAHWVRVSADRACTASATFVYE
jgi:hypothetical protein